ncbi:MAG TPA: NAD-dependent epimerase/dehydratase family protein [Thermoplasmataceae archaeon]|nr:NAD-dependent epimerase/dehydratase family protein [Thermoplasmataceae archaeon]
MKAIIIGGSGYVGSSLAVRLTAEKVTYLSRHRNKMLDEKNIEFIEGSILDADKMLQVLKDYDTVIDCAGQDYDSDQKLFDLHVNGVKNVVSALRKFDTDQRFIFFSSINVHYGTTEFFRTKRTGEDNAALLKNHLIVRPSFIYGGNDHLMPVLKKVAESSLRKLPQGGSISPVHIDDLVRVIEAAKDIRGAIDVASREKISFPDAVNAVAERIGKKRKKIVSGRFGLKSALQKLKESGLIHPDNVDRYLLNFYRENTYLDRFVRAPRKFSDFIAAMEP